MSQANNIKQKKEMHVKTSLLVFLGIVSAVTLLFCWTLYSTFVSPFLLKKQLPNRGLRINPDLVQTADKLAKKASLTVSTPSATLNTQTNAKQLKAEVLVSASSSALPALTHAFESNNITIAKKSDTDATSSSVAYKKAIITKETLTSILPANLQAVPFEELSDSYPYDLKIILAP